MPAYHFTLFGKQYYFTTRFAALTFLLLLIFIYFGHLELNQAQSKKEMISLSDTRTNSNHVGLTELQKNAENLRYYSVHLEGTFDNNHTLLLQKSAQGTNGYEVLTPFKPNGSSTAILVDRGYVPGTGDPNILPKIAITNDIVVVNGVLDVPSLYFGSGRLYNEKTSKWPIIVVRHLDFDAMSTLVGYGLFPYLVMLDPGSPYGFVRNWNLLTERPEINTAHAIAWFLLTIATFFAFIILNIHRVRQSKQN